MSCLYLVVWHTIWLRQEIHMLVQSQWKRHQTASDLSDMVSFLLTSNKLGSISSLAQNTCQLNILDKDLFQVGIWEVDAVFKLCQFLLFPIWISYVRNVCWKNSINFFQDFVLQNLNLCVKICSVIDERTLVTLHNVAIHLPLITLSASIPPQNKTNLHTVKIWACSK